MDHDEALIRAFVRPDQRRRYLGKLVKDRGWIEDRLDHMPDLNERYATELRIPGPGSLWVYDLLKSKGAPSTCHVVGGGDLDGEELDLREVLDKVVGFDYGTMISCIEGRLGYLESEDGRYLLERP